MSFHTSSSMDALSKSCSLQVFLFLFVFCVPLVSNYIFKRCCRLRSYNHSCFCEGSSINSKKSGFFLSLCYLPKGKKISLFVCPAYCWYAADTFVLVERNLVLCKSCGSSIKFLTLLVPKTIYYNLIRRKESMIKERTRLKSYDHLFIPTSPTVYCFECV